MSVKTLARLFFYGTFALVLLALCGKPGSFLYNIGHFAAWVSVLAFGLGAIAGLAQQKADGDEFVDNIKKTMAQFGTTPRKELADRKKDAIRGWTVRITIILIAAGLGWTILALAGTIGAVFVYAYNKEVYKLLEKIVQGKDEKIVKEEIA